MRRLPGGGDWTRALPEDPDALVEGVLTDIERHVGTNLARVMRFMGLTTLEWEARGAVVRDVHGREYLDCGGYGMFLHGHSHPHVVAAVQRQAALLAQSTRLLPHAGQAQLAARLAAVAPQGLQYAFFSNSGAESVEAALKLARAATGRTGVLDAEGGCHGKTLGALSATGKPAYRDPFQPLLAGFTHVPYGDAAALFDACERAAAQPGGLAAVLLEPIQGEAGVVIPPDGYLAAARAACDRHGALLILDEVQTGMGRTGTLFGCGHSGVRPDILTLAKSLGGGVMPIGATLATAACWRPFDENPFLHTSTFGGSPLACAAALAALEAIEQEDLCGRARALGERIGPDLRRLADAHASSIAAVRGVGLLWGIELRSEGLGGWLLSRLLDAGVLVVHSLNQPRVLRVMPPALLTSEQWGFVLQALDGAAAEADALAAELTVPDGAG